MASRRERPAKRNPPRSPNPEAYRQRLDEIVELTDSFCDQFLNDEYKAICLKLAVALYQKGSPLLSGKGASWACGIVYAVGRVNFLTDPSQEPHLTAEQIAAGCGVSIATMHAKSRVITDLMDLSPLDPDFTVASLMDESPLVWMLEVNGFLVDIRRTPREFQVLAFEKGLIPYIPADQE